MRTRQSYTPGYSENSTDFMTRRSFRSHGDFFLPYLAPGTSVLDCGCGPGTITLGIAERVAPGGVVGVDIAAPQIERATTNAAGANICNVSFQTADCHALPFEESKFDRIFSHALLEHLTDPVRALREFRRVLRPSGIIGVCSPDWAGFLLSPPSPALSRAVEAYTGLHSRNGGDPGVGRKLGKLLASAGFREICLSARYECYPSLDLIGGYLAAQLEHEGNMQAAEVFRAWSKSDGGMFAQAWVAATAHK